MDRSKGAPGWGLFIAGVGLGIVMEFFVDPVRGRRRRTIVADKAGSLVRHLSWRTDKFVRHSKGRVYGVFQRAVHLMPADNPEPDDVTLTNKVKSEIFRMPDIPKSCIVMEAYRGVVTLRGQVEDPGLIHRIQFRVRRIPGVTGVENYLHLPGEGAPNKAHPMSL